MIFMGIGLFLILFLGTFAGKVWLIPKRLAATAELMEKGRYTEAQKNIAWLERNNEQLRGIFKEGEVGELLRAEAEVTELLRLNIKLAQRSEKISQGIFTEEEVDIKKELGGMEKEVGEAIAKMGLLSGRLSGQWKVLPGRFKKDFLDLKEKISEEKVKAERVEKILPIMPEILGLDGKRREYLVLLQNENELRPTGGFIGSWAILSFEGGKYLNFEVKDVYEGDGQLKGHVEPPEEIKKYLGEGGWFLRDANWKASFPESARDIEWFLEKETGRRVDGVIGINLASVKAILEVVGEITVPDFKEKVNADNLYQQAEYYSENKFFPGSVQKASFLSGVSKQLMEEIRGSKSKEGEGLVAALVELLDKNEVQIALNNSKAAAVMAEAGWDGAMYGGKCSGGQCMADYFYIVEANLGVNKANYFIYRNIEREVNIEEKQVKNRVRINYENTAKSNAWPGGDYKNYLRVYVPREIRVEEVTIGAGGSKKVVAGEELVIKEVGGRKEVGFLVVVESGKKMVVELKFSQEIDLSGVNKFSYLSMAQRQSGFGEPEMVTLINLPQNWQIVAVEPAADVVGGKLLFKNKFDRDLRFGVEISK